VQKLAADFTADGTSTWLHAGGVPSQAKRPFLGINSPIKNPYMDSVDVMF
jgi:hypothetical protein